MTLLTQICQEFPDSIKSIKTQFADFLTALESIKVFFVDNQYKKIEDLSDLEREKILERGSYLILELKKQFLKGYDKISKELSFEMQEDVRLILNEFTSMDIEADVGRQISVQITKGETINSKELESFNAFLEKDEKVRNNQIFRAKLQKKTLDLLEELFESLEKYLPEKNTEFKNLFKELKYGFRLVDLPNTEFQTSRTILNIHKTEYTLHKMDQYISKLMEDLQGFYQSFYKKLAFPIRQEIRVIKGKIDLTMDRISQGEELCDEMLHFRPIDQKLLKNFDNLLKNDEEVRKNQLSRAKLQEESLNLLKKNLKEVIEVVGNTPKMEGFSKDLQDTSHLINDFINKCQSPITVLQDQKLERILRTVQQRLEQYQETLKQFLEKHPLSSFLDFHTVEQNYEQIDAIFKKVKEGEKISDEMRRGGDVDERLLEDFEPMVVG